MIGSKIKELRKTKNMSLTELSKESGVQLATLSRMENNKMTGTLESHLNIAKALGVDITAFYNGITKEEQKIDFRDHKSPADIFVHSDKASYEILTNKLLSKKMMPVLLKIEPGGQTASEQNSTGSEKFLYVLEGSIEVRIGQDAYPLSKQNTLYFDASLAHYLINIGKVTAKVLCVGTPVAL